MSKEMEGKLVEEARLLWCEECADGPLSYEFGYDPDVDEHCTSGAEDLCRERARKVITRIGKAYADGLELPGEVGRTTREFMMGEGIPPDQMLHWWLDARLKQGATRFIALCPSGTGKEEGA